ncbi:AgrD family cyclic lactone autoinducer peptide [Paenibacillus sp. sgz5001063]
MNLVANVLTKVASAAVSTNSFLFFFKGNIPAELLKK